MPERLLPATEGARETHGPGRDPVLEAHHGPLVRLVPDAPLEIGALGPVIVAPEIERDPDGMARVTQRGDQVGEDAHRQKHRGHRQKRGGGQGVTLGLGEEVRDVPASDSSDPEKVLQQKQNIIHPLPEWRDMDPVGAQPVVQVFSEFSGLFEIF